MCNASSGRDPPAQMRSCSCLLTSLLSNSTSPDFYHFQMCSFQPRWTLTYVTSIEYFYFLHAHILASALSVEFNSCQGFSHQFVFLKNEESSVCSSACNLPGSDPCRPGFSQPAAAGTDWDGPCRQYHRPAPRCSYRRITAGQHTRTAGSLMSHSDKHCTLGCI